MKQNVYESITVYTESFYTTPELATFFKEMMTDRTANVRMGRKNLPPILEKNKLNI
jgi:hypothetical protein